MTLTKKAQRKLPPIKKQLTEAVIKAKVKKMLKELSVFWFMPVQKGYGKRGIPDFVVCAGGQFIGIETKRPDKKNNLSAHQKLVEKEINANYGKYFVIYNEETLISVATQIEWRTHYTNWD